jgi:hypothetical protein
MSRFLWDIFRSGVNHIVRTIGTEETNRQTARRPSCLPEIDKSFQWSRDGTRAIRARISMSLEFSD